MYWLPVRHELVTAEQQLCTSGNQRNKVNHLGSLLLVRELWPIIDTLGMELDGMNPNDACCRQ